MVIRLDTKLQLTNNNTYKESSLKVLKENLHDYHSLGDIKKNLDRINSYEHLDKIAPPAEVYTFDENVISENKLDKAKQCILNGGIFFEHAAAGEATRLGLGTKYLINIPRQLPLKKVSEMISEEKGETVAEAEVKEAAGCSPDELIELSLGTRHMAQLAFDIYRLAKEFSREPEAVFSLQKMLIILNETSAEDIIEEFKQHQFFGFSPMNIFFMIQKSFHGINIDKNGDFFYDENAPKRLHNHGHMVMQQTMDDEIFYLDPEKDYSKRFLKSSEFGKVLRRCDDKISYNIEDIGYLKSSIDYASLAVALDMKERGYNMTMEIVLNNPIKPQKGASVYHDPVLEKDVMIETHQLGGIDPKEIKYLNKNFNHYPEPHIAWSKLKEKGLPMSIDVKDDFIYFKPVQGDINFLVQTQFVRRKVLKPIQNWKSPVTTPPTIKAMKEQDTQEGFREFLEGFLGLDI